MSKNIKIIIVVVAVVGVLALIALVKPASFGGTVHNIVEQFVPGIVIGDAQNPTCIKVSDTDKGGWSYITYLNGVETVTGGTAGAFTIPNSCLGK
jgi:hypothetical protein